MINQSDKRKRGRASRNKGANAERELANLIRDTWGYEVKRGKVFYGESDLVGLDGIHPEVKRVEKLNIHAAMAQAIEEAKKREDGLPAVFFRRDRGEWLVTMRLEDWIDLYGAWIDE
ncbi:MAG: hypothetical protein IJ706_08335 [Clostridia bacterium]|nr:hypothetical protein [Clostridia bacterium]